MTLKKNQFIFNNIISLLFAPLLTFSQANQKNPLSEAIQAFDAKNYKEAELLFKAVLDEKPDDFMVNYFYGACRTENNNFTNTDLECLIKANQEVSPININYYFGIQYHARSNWERALKFYNKFNSSTKLVGEEKNNLLNKIQQCYDKINPFEKYMVSENVAVPAEVTATGASEVLAEIAATADSLEKINETELIDSMTSTIIPEADTAQVLEEYITTDAIQGSELINFEVNSDILYLYTSQFKTEMGKLLFTEGNEKQKELEKALKRSEILRSKYKDARYTQEKELIGQEILSLENTTYALKKEVATLLYQSKNAEKEYWENADSVEMSEFRKEMDRLNQIKTKKTESSKAAGADSVPFINPNILLGNMDEMVSPPDEEPVKKELVYKIQLGAYSRGLPDYIKKIYQKLSYIRKIENYTDENGIVVYTTGNLSNLEDAEKMKKQVQQEGVERATVVPYFKGKRITLAQAKELQAK